MTDSAPKHPFTPIASLDTGDSVESVYHLLSVEQRTKKNGDPYFALQVGDASGQSNAVMWDNHHALVAEMVKEDDFVLVKADAGFYNNNLQLTLKQISRVEDAEVDLSLFLPVSPRDRGEMEAELDAWIARVTNPDCVRLLGKFFSNPRLRELYCTAPAAARIHQAYIHGLMDHTLNVLRLADSIANVYEPVNRDVLITAGLLHDIGKIRELDWKRTIRYTTEGRLLGHISMGASMVDSVINGLKKQPEGFDESIHQQILHLILSHHGKLEWGSPIRPQSREALLLHYADHTEAYMAVVVEQTAKAATKGETWTPFNRMFESYLYAGNIDPEQLPGAKSPEGFVTSSPGFAPQGHPDDSLSPK